MTSRNTTDEGSSFGKLVAWTVALALVFSAGLITGQRLLRRAAMPPMVSLSSTTNTDEAKEAAQAAAEATPTATDSLRTTFSFYDHLTAAPARKNSAGAKKPPITESEDEKPDDSADPGEEAGEEVEPDAPEEVEPDAPEEVEPKPPAEVDEDVEESEEPPQAAAEEGSSEETNSDKPSMLDTVARVLADEKPDDEKAKEKPAALPARYTLQVSSHPDRGSAEREMDRLRKLGVEPHVVVVEVPGKGKLWRIRVGKFHKMDEAREFQRSLKSKRGVPGFVTPL